MTGRTRASWQKGGIENANGRLRRWLPRQTNLDDISDEDMQEIVMTYIHKQN
jgi:IS30 family transposase